MWPVSRSIGFSVFIGVVAYIRISVLFKVEFHCTDHICLFMHLSVGIYVGCFLFLTHEYGCWEHWGTKLCLNLCFWFLNSCGFILQCGTATSYGHLGLPFCRLTSLVLHSGYSSLVFVVVWQQQLYCTSQKQQGFPPCLIFQPYEIFLIMTN